MTQPFYRTRTAAFALGALFVALFVAAWPYLPTQNRLYVVNFKGDARSSGAQCAMMTKLGYSRAPYGGPEALQPCLVELAGHFNDRGDFVAVYEQRNPFDFAYRLTRDGSALIPKESIRQVCELHPATKALRDQGCLDATRVRLES